MVTARQAALAAVAALALVLLAGCAVPASPATTETPSAADSGSGTEPFTVTDIELPYSAVFKPQKVGQAIYASVPRGTDLGASVIRYDLASSTIETIASAPDPDLIGWLTVNEDWLVWTVGKDINARSLASGEETVVSSTRELCAPALNGNLLAWDDLSPRRTHQITVHDLASGETTVLAQLETADLYNNFPAWEGDKLVWTDVKGDTGHYYVYDAKTQETTDYPLADIRFRYPGYAETAGDRIYSVNFDRTDEWDWTVQQLGYYSIAQSRFVPAAPAGTIINSFRVANGLLATVDDAGELTVRSSDAPAGAAAEYHPLDKPIDAVDRSTDGSMIAWRNSDEPLTPVVLHVIEAK